MNWILCAAVPDRVRYDLIFELHAWRLSNIVGTTGDRTARGTTEVKVPEIPEVTAQEIPEVTAPDDLEMYPALDEISEGEGVVISDFAFCE